jgi:hypothetical protein
MYDRRDAQPSFGPGPRGEHHVIVGVVPIVRGAVGRSNQRFAASTVIIAPRGGSPRGASRVRSAGRAFADYGDWRQLSDTWNVEGRSVCRCLAFPLIEEDRKHGSGPTIVR